MNNNKPPFLQVYENFLTKAECEYIINLSNIALIK